MLKFMCLILLLSNILTENVSDEYIDPVIGFLLNGETQSNQTITEEPENLTAGIWKCGNCTDLDDSRIVYSEENYIEADENDDPGDEETKIELILDGMRCVTVAADKPGAVQRLTGACNGAVTLYMTRARHFIVHVYA